jgi:hypothetical protein
MDCRAQVGGSSRYMWWPHAVRTTILLNQVPQAFDKSVMGTVSVRIASTDATAVAAPVAVTVGPVITSVSPPTAARGTVDLAITVAGSGLADASSLAFLLNNTPDPNVTPRRARRGPQPADGCFAMTPRGAAVLVENSSALLLIGQLIPRA